MILLFSGQCFFTKQNAADVMMTADLFQMLTLKSAAVNCLLNCVDTSNCLLVQLIDFYQQNSSQCCLGIKPYYDNSLVT